MTMLNYPDAETVVRARLIDFFGLDGGQVGRMMPDPNEPFGATLPYFRVHELPTSDEGELTRTARVDVDIFDSTVTGAKILARTVSTVFTTRWFQVEIEGRRHTIAKCGLNPSFAQQVYEDDAVERWSGTLELPMRR